MSYLSFTPFPETIFGAGSISVLGEKAKALGGTKALLVFGPHVEAAGIPAKAIKSLEEAGLEYVCFNGVRPDPPVEVVDAAVEVGLAAGVDIVIGIGGGSSMDTAKCASIMLSGFEGPASRWVLAIPPMVNTTCPVILVPTTGGTGSEVTRVAVITRPDANAKWSVFVNTNLAIVDPELMLSLPAEHTACTGLDALAHCFEAITNRDRNAVSDANALVGIRKINDNIIRAYENPTDLEARTEMALAATIAGLAFKDPLCHLAHAMGDAYGCNFHTPHGQSCVFGLTAAVKLVADKMPREMALIAEAMSLPVRGDESGEELGQLIIDNIYRIMRAIGIKSQKELGFPREKVISMAEEVVANHLTGHAPIPVTLEMARELLAYSYDDYQ